MSITLPEVTALRPYADDRVLPVLPSLAKLLPGGALRRGSTVTVAGSTSLLLALLAGPSQVGSWCAVVGLPGLGLLAAAETGVALPRLALVPEPGTHWLAVTAALLDGLDVVVVRPPARVRPSDARRLSARARERGAVLVIAGVPAAPNVVPATVSGAAPGTIVSWEGVSWEGVSWEGADVSMALTRRRWTGLGPGHGRLRGCEIEVRAGGRGAAARPRQARLRLPTSGLAEAT